MSEFYKMVFKTYPFPICNPDYIKETITTPVDYYCVEYDGKIIALSSA